MESESTAVPTLSLRAFLFWLNVSAILFDILWDMPERRRVAALRDPEFGPLFRQYEMVEEQIDQIREMMLGDGEDTEHLNHLEHRIRRARLKDEERVRPRLDRSIWLRFALVRLF